MSDDRRCDRCGQPVPILIWQKIPGASGYVKHCRACHNARSHAARR